MREIKFRAWDKKNKCWYQPICEAYKGNLYDLLISFKGILLAHTMEGIQCLEREQNDFILLQFTGLKDKNGKEIYEGDVVVYWWDEKETVDEGRGFVEMRNGCFGYETIRFKRFFNLHNKLRVIGNIYENPELLRAK
jgi:uncharacterized phage protein (TIGR01671 family)